MLEKLGEVLRKATNKIANAIFLDKNLVDSVVRDLQRAMIEADVNVSLVKDLSDKIKKTALDEKIKEIDKKEHIIKLLHDELVEILGEHKQLALQSKEQNRIILLGLYGAGKCVHSESKIQLGNGEIIKAKKLYERYKDLEENIEDGKIINIQDKRLQIPSFNPKTLKIENKKATYLWKLKKDELIEVKIGNGNDSSIKVTPEHPFFVLKNGQITQIRADELTKEDFISIPNKIEIEGKTINLFDYIKNLNLEAYLTPKEAKQNILKKYNSIKEGYSNLKYKKNYSYLTSIINKGRIPIEFIEKEKYNFLRLKHVKSSKIISFPLHLTQELSEFIGYVIGDGYISERSIHISNEDIEIINRIIELSKIIFNLTPTLTKDKRSKNLYYIRLNSVTLVKILQKFGFNVGKKGRNLEIPKQIMLSNNEVIRSFIKAYFDCDSSPSKNKRYIEVSSESYINLQQMSLLLRRLGILSSISKKIINNISYWTLYIKGKYAEIYSEKIGYLINYKQKITEKYNQIGKIQGAGNQDMIPLGNSLKALRFALGFSIGEIQENAVYSYGIYEKKGLISKEQLKKLLLYYRMKKEGVFLGILNDISNNISISNKYSYRAVNGILKHLKQEGFVEKGIKNSLTERGMQYLQIIHKSKLEPLLKSFELLSSSNICWTPVKEINHIKNDEKFVYDLTVEDNHSFLADGIVVHNTTTIAKIGNYYAKRGHKVALVGLDTHRPAAPEQLKQLAEKYNLNCFIDAKEKNPIKIWKKFERELKDYDLILIDTAGRHTLDKELIKEIKQLEKTIKPTENILVMPADIGQAAHQQASQFKEAVNISGVIITRMDSTAKAGGALTACNEVKAPVYFIGTGEKANDIEEFNPENFLSRLLGMGDLQSLIEKIKSATGGKKQEAMQKRLQEGKLSIEDVIEQVKSMGSMGGLDKIKNMVPGFANIEKKVPENLLENQEAKISKWEHIVKSMTPEEKENPELLEKETSRIARIAKGAGVHGSDVRSLLKQYKMLNEMIKEGMSGMNPEKAMSQKQLMKMAKKFMKGGKFRL